MASKLNDLPTYVQARMLNEDLYRVTIGVLEMYRLSNNDNNRKFAQIINNIFFKEAPLQSFHDLICQ